MKKPRTLNFIDLFCGAGGLSYGLEKIFGTLPQISNIVYYLLI